MAEAEYTRTDRVYIDETVSDIYAQLKTGANTQLEAAPFETFKDLFMLAASLGFEHGRRVRTINMGSEIRVSVLTEDDWALLKAIAIAETGDVQVLENDAEILAIAEEYANSGIHEVKADLLDERGQPLWNLVDLFRQQ